MSNFFREFKVFVRTVAKHFEVNLIEIVELSGCVITYFCKVLFRQFFCASTTTRMGA